MLQKSDQLKIPFQNEKLRLYRRNLTKNNATIGNNRDTVRLGYSNNSRFATPTTKMGLETCFVVKFMNVQKNFM